MTLIHVNFHFFIFVSFCVHTLATWRCIIAYLLHKFSLQFVFLRTLLFGNFAVRIIIIYIMYNTGCIKKVYSWKILAKLTSALILRKLSTS